MNPQLFYYKQPFKLESGRTLPSFHLAYTSIGKLNAGKDNVIWIFHALTANSNAAEWWPGLVGAGKLFDPATHFIICVNMPGSHYGSMSPLDLDEETGEPFFHQFPLFTTRDMIRAYQKLKTHLGINRVKVGIGGSMGGQQLLEWAIEEPELFDTIVPIATNAKHSPWGIAFNATQRFCIEQDPTWKERKPTSGIEGMKSARAIALLSYRNYDTYAATQQGLADDSRFRAETYQQYQGEKLAKRFNAFSYYFLSKGMDSHNVGRDRGSLEEALSGITAKTLVISISSDILFPPTEQKFLAAQIPGASLVIINSFFGHDGFLLEYEKISAAINSFRPVKPSFPINSN